MRSCAAGRDRRSLDAPARVQEHDLIVQGGGEDCAQHDHRLPDRRGLTPRAFCGDPLADVLGRMSIIRIGPNSGMMCRTSDVACIAAASSPRSDGSAARSAPRSRGRSAGRGRGRPRALVDLALRPLPGPVSLPPAGERSGGALAPLGPGTARRTGLAVGTRPAPGLNPIKTTCQRIEFVPAVCHQEPPDQHAASRWILCNHGSTTLT